MSAQQTRVREIFPLPALPMPYRPLSHSRRVRQRTAHAARTTMLANSCARSLNSMFSSFSSQFQARISSPQFQNEQQLPTAAQSRVQAHLHRCANRFASRLGDELPVSGMCDSISSNNFNHLIDTLRYAADFQYASFPSYPSAVPLVAGRVALPDSAGSVQLTNMLPEALVRDCLSPDKLLKSQQNIDYSRLPPATRYCSDGEYEQLISRMKAAGMLSFTTNPKVVNGVFGTPKDGDAIRLIIDARAANQVFIDPPKVKLPTPDLTASLQVPKNMPLFVAKVDLDNFYHRLRLPEWLQPYFALPPLPARSVGLESQFGDFTLVYPCCATLPMGWSHSVFLAQAAHEHFLDTHTTLSRRSRIQADNPDALKVRIDGTRHQVYIDDLLLFSLSEMHLSAAQNEYVLAAQKFGLVVKMSKIVRPTSDPVECLGLEVNGTDHTVGLSPSKLLQLCNDTRALVVRGFCTGLELSQLVGRWTWASLACRPVLSVMNSVYRFIQCAGNRMFTIWNSVKTELRCLEGLMPILFTSLDLPFFDKIVACDASSTGLGVVSSPQVFRNLQEAATVVAPVNQPTPETSSDESSATISTGLQANINVLSRLRWSTIVSSRWRRPEHINVLELRALTTALRWVVSFPSSFCSRPVFVCDSQVCVYAVAKGRSSSPPLLRRLRCFNAFLLAFGCRPLVKWIPTHVNPADEPSRRF